MGAAVWNKVLLFGQTLHDGYHTLQVVSTLHKMPQPCGILHGSTAM